MDIILTSDQENAKKSIIEWYLNLDTQCFVLSGYAGTGKTFLLKHVVCECLNLVPDKQAAFVAPTAKPLPFLSAAELRRLPFTALYIRWTTTISTLTKTARS